MFTGQLAVVATPVRLIVDTDIGGGSCRDVDDVGAICMANALADNGEVDLLAVIVNTRPVQGVRAVAAINAWYGRDVPIGAYRPPVPDDGLWPHPPILPWIGTLPHGTSDPLPYVDRLASEWPSCPQVQSAVDVYRRVLAAQPDRSVTISSIGLLTNLEAVLKSSADGHSRLSGRDLVARKVRYLAVMGGEYPRAPRSSSGR